MSHTKESDIEVVKASESTKSLWEEIGFHKVDFDIGVGHGISLKDGTH